MKKLLSIVLAITMMFILCSCENKEALAVEEMITALGEITLQSGPAISVTQDAFDALDAKDRLEVRNSAALAAAQITYQNLKKNEQADVIEQLIHDLRPITTSSAKALTNAENIYNSADIEVKLKVENFPDMVDAFQLYRFLTIDQVEVKITALGEVTLESGPAIEKARAAYDALSDEDQTWVYNGYELVAAEKQLKALQDAETAPTEETK